MPPCDNVLALQHRRECARSAADVGDRSNPTKLEPHAVALPAIVRVPPGDHDAALLHCGEGALRGVELLHRRFAVQLVLNLVAVATGVGVAPSHDCPLYEQRGKGTAGGADLPDFHPPLQPLLHIEDILELGRAPRHDAPVCDRRGKGPAVRVAPGGHDLRHASQTNELGLDDLGPSAFLGVTPRHHAAVLQGRCKGMASGVDLPHGGVGVVQLLPDAAAVAALVPVAPGHDAPLVQQRREGVARGADLPHQHVAAELLLHGAAIAARIPAAPGHDASALHHGSKGAARGVDLLHQGRGEQLALWVLVPRGPHSQPDRRLQAAPEQPAAPRHHASAVRGHGGLVLHGGPAAHGCGRSRRGPGGAVPGA
mmetsp:Transcript_85601/g.277248  ORF Transcript_85601/g.277248 Transcript_85601/m.277248 type:complete len:368 (+) Transcript_85601:485-1588(+)